MRIVFLGTSPFAVPCLRELLNSPAHTVIGVVTQPDRPSGRGGRVLASPIKEWASTHGLPLFQPEKVRAREFVQTVRELAPDVLVVAAFGQIIPQRMLDISPFGGVNVHGSLLPRWRGAAPMQYALMAGDDTTGVSTMQMDAGLDTGDVLLQASFPLADVKNWGALEKPLSELGATLLMETLDKLAAGTCPRTVQDAALVTLSPSLPPDIGRLDFSHSAVTLHNLVRGTTPKPGAFCLYAGKRLKVLRTEVADSDALPGIIYSVSKAGIVIGTQKGALRLCVVQPESKAPMDADAWARGARVAAGSVFDPAP